MDYKKKLALAKEALESGSYDRETIEYIFPELKESEAERIRKEILEYFQQFENEELRGVDISDWIAWLEMQGEKKPQRIISAEAKEAMYDKPAWSEEDEWHLKSVISRTKEFGDSSVFGLVNNDIQWLKSIKERLKGE